MNYLAISQLMVIVVIGAAYCPTFVAAIPPLLRLNSTRSENKPFLTIPTVMSYGGFIYPMGPLCTKGIQIALDTAEKKLQLFDRYQIAFDLYDEQSDYAVGVGASISIMESTLTGTAENNTFPLMIGPLFAPLWVGVTLQYYNFVALADFSNNVETIVYRKMYNSFFGIASSFDSFYEAIPVFLQSNGWSRVFLMSETFTFWIPQEHVLQFNLVKRNIILAGVAKVPIPPDMMPLPEHFEMAVQELANMNPRIIILDTSYGALLACYLHKHKLFGSSFVYLVQGTAFLQPNAVFRAEGCTDKMIFEVLQSFIYFAYASPLNMFEGATDDLGMNKTTFEAELVRRVGGQPHLTSIWFFWRGLCYSEAVATLAILDRVESKLRQVNDSLLNWVTQGEKFQTNGSYISALLRSTIDAMSFKSLTNSNEHPNSRKGPTGFYQIQLSVSDDELANVKDENLPAVIKAVPVATYDSSKSDASLIWGPGKLLWKGRNGQAPLDLLRVIPAKEPLIGQTANGLLDAFAGLLLLTNSILFAATIYKRSSENISRSLPWLNALVLSGNVLITLFVLVLPVGGGEKSHINCMAATFLLTVGFALVVTSILAKMELGNMLGLMFRRTTSGGHRQGSQQHNSQQHSVRLGSNQLSGITFNIQAPPPVLQCSAEMIAKLKGNAKLAFIFSLLWAGFNLLLVAIWFGLEPIETVQYERNLEFSSRDISLAYQHYTMSCGNPTSPISIGFICAIIALHVIIFLRSFYLAFTAKKVIILEINDLTVVRMVSYGIPILVGASAAVIGGIFKDSDPGTLQIAVSCAALFVVALTTIVIFVPKLKDDFFTPSYNVPANASIKTMVQTSAIAVARLR